MKGYDIMKIKAIVLTACLAMIFSIFCMPYKSSFNANAEETTDLKNLPDPSNNNVGQLSLSLYSKDENLNTDSYSFGSIVRIMLFDKNNIPLRNYSVGYYKTDKNGMLQAYVESENHPTVLTLPDKTRYSIVKGTYPVTNQNYLEILSSSSGIIKKGETITQKIEVALDTSGSLTITEKNINFWSDRDKNIPEEEKKQTRYIQIKFLPYSSDYINTKNLFCLYSKGKDSGKIHLDYSTPFVFSLRPKESIRFYNIPRGTSYYVSEYKRSEFDCDNDIYPNFYPTTSNMLGVNRNSNDYIDVDYGSKLGETFYIPKFIKKITNFSLRDDFEFELSDMNGNVIRSLSTKIQQSQDEFEFDRLSVPNKDAEYNYILSEKQNFLNAKNSTDNIYTYSKRKIYLKLIVTVSDSHANFKLLASLKPIADAKESEINVYEYDGHSWDDHFKPIKINDPDLFTFNNALNSLVTFSKKDKKGNELKGAKLSIYNKETGEKVNTWISGCDGDNDDVLPHNVYLPSGRYRLHEDSAPSGYEKARDIDFSVNDDGTIEQNKQKVAFVEMTDPDEELKENTFIKENKKKNETTDISLNKKKDEKTVDKKKTSKSKNIKNNKEKKSKKEKNHKTASSPKTYDATNIEKYVIMFVLAFGIILAIRNSVWNDSKY